MKTIPGLPKLAIGSIYCIGKNYQKHAAEMGSTVPSQPIVFLKPASSIIGDGETIKLPPQSQNVHHEVELAIAIGDKAQHIAPQNAHKYIAGYGVGVDVTARDIQQKAKDRGHPWSVAKGFDTFAPLSTFLPLKTTTDFNNMELVLVVNNTMRQQDNTKNMIFPVQEIVSYLSTIFTLYPGDLIFTGTPHGVSAINLGDRIEASLNKNECVLTLSVAGRDEEY